MDYLVEIPDVVSKFEDVLLMIDKSPGGHLIIPRLWPGPKSPSGRALIPTLFSENRQSYSLLHPSTSFFSFL